MNGVKKGFIQVSAIFYKKFLPKIKKKKIKILGLVTGFFIVANIEAIGQTLYEGFDDITIMLPVLIMAVILAGIFVIIKVIYRQKASRIDKMEVSRPVDIWYLVGLCILVGIYNIALEILNGKFEFGSVGILIFAAGYFFLASQLWLKKIWAWNVSMILAYFQAFAGTSMLESSGWNPMNAVPLMINLAIIISLIQPITLQFYKKEKNVFLKYVEKVSES